MSPFLSFWVSLPRHWGRMMSHILLQCFCRDAILWMVVQLDFSIWKREGLSFLCWKWWLGRKQNDFLLPARCSGVELRPCVSLQLMFSKLHSFWTRARQPFLAASKSAASPLSKSWISVSPSFTMSNGVFPSRFFLVGSAPCWRR